MSFPIGSLIMMSYVSTHSSVSLVSIEIINDKGMYGDYGYD